MTRDQLEHAIRAACDVADDTEIFVFGSQAILAEWPEAPATLRMSSEADVMPKNRPERAEQIDGALGELSLFHQTHGFYVRGVPVTAAALPVGWERRLVRVSNANTRHTTGLCIECHDLAASKLAAFREKDRDFVRTLLAQRMIRPQTLIRRLQNLPIASALRNRLVTWVRQTVRELSAHA